MNVGSFLFYLFLSSFFCSVNSIAIDDFHCKIPTCRDFFFVSFSFLLIDQQWTNDFRAWKNILVERNTKRSVLKLSMLYKLSHRIMANVSMIKQANWMNHVFVSDILRWWERKWFVRLLKMLWQKRSKIASINWMIFPSIKHDIIVVIHWWSIVQYILVSMDILWNLIDFSLNVIIRRRTLSNIFIFYLSCCNFLMMNIFNKDRYIRVSRPFYSFIDDERSFQGEYLLLVMNGGNADGTIVISVKGCLASLLMNFE